MSHRACLLAVTALGASLAIVPRLDPPWLIWSASASVPIGLYAVEPPTKLQVADLVVIRPPEPVARFLADGGYLPRGAPLLKHVLALFGQEVCRVGFVITVRRSGDWRCARTRQPRPSAAGLAGLPRHGQGRSLPDESAVRGLARRTVFRGAARFFDHRPRVAMSPYGQPRPFCFAPIDVVRICSTRVRRRSFNIL
jgi:type IV secretory pathway protease TraF